MAIAVLLCYPLTFSRSAVRAFLFCMPFMASVRKYYCLLPTAFFLSSACQSTDVANCNAICSITCIICFIRRIYKLLVRSQLYSIDRLELIPLIIRCGMILLRNSWFMCTPCNRHRYFFCVATLTTCYTT